MKMMIVLGLLTSLFGCSSPANVNENDTITHFSLSEGGGMNRFSGFGYLVEETKDGKVHFLFNEGFPDEKELFIDDHSVFDSLQAIILKHKIYKYHGHYQPRFDITDGTSWSLSVDYASGKEISAGGYMAGPDGYWVAFNEIIRCLDQWKALPAASNDIESFKYIYGQEQYLFERKDDHTELTYDNQETGEHKVLQRGLEMLDELRVFININRFKMDNTRGNLDFEYTPWMYEINYSNGDHYLYEGYETTFQSGYTRALQGFVTNCMREERDPYYYMYY